MMNSFRDKEISWPPEESSYPLVLSAPDKEEWRQEAATFLRDRGIPWARTVTFATSGSSGGEPKGVVFFPEALEVSARGVNQWLGADKGGAWCCPLLPYHVGGFMIYVRAALAGTKVYPFWGKWNARRFAEFLNDWGIVWSSLVPAQVVDIVTERVKAPSSLKAIVVGGGALNPEMGEAARALGWPVVQSYGMTESASQIATATLTEPYAGKDMPILPHWDIQVSKIGRTLIKGPARFAAYVKKRKGKWHLEEINSNDYWEASDMVSVNDGKLTFLRRSDRLVKILGELVDVDWIEDKFAASLPGALICSLPHSRKGMVLYACHPEESLLLPLIKQWNDRVSGIHRIEGGIITDIPLNFMGKIDRKGLEKICLKKYRGD